MKWSKTSNSRLPIKSWCETIEEEAMRQAVNLAGHPVTRHHVALMPDCHVGYGMPIGGVIACENAVIPNAVGVDIGCGMVAVRTDFPASRLKDMRARRELLEAVKALVPVGEGRAHRTPRDWEGFSRYRDTLPKGHPGEISWPNKLDEANLGTLGGGNHFIELQAADDGHVWLMIHSGSRNLGYRIAAFYHKAAQRLNERAAIALPAADLAFLPLDDELGQAYIRDMTFALDYARENRRLMMDAFKQVAADRLPGANFLLEVNIHHNYAALETHFGNALWVHRKGATSARDGETGIVPGSMGTPSYIVRGLGNPESFMSCSHGAGRTMGRAEASRRLSVEACDKAMEGVAFDRWSKFRDRHKRKKGEKALYDLSESPLAYKNIEDVIAAELDLLAPLVRLRPLGVLKG